MLSNSFIVLFQDCELTLTDVMETDCSTLKQNLSDQDYKVAMAARRRKKNNLEADKSTKRKAVRMARLR